MENKLTIWLDMDGTIADLYGVDNWLENLQSENVEPYKKAKTLYNENELADLFRELSKKFNLGIISWAAKNASADYLTKIRKSKIEWLKNKGLLNFLDMVYITEYGRNKSDFCKMFSESGILVDDDDKNLQEWELGDIYDAKVNIITQLKTLL